MINLTRTAIFFAALAWAGAALPQDAKNQTSDEDARIGRIIERWLQLNETERDHVLREISRGNDGKVDDDYNQWFTRLGGNDDGWDRTLIQRKRFAEIFDRMAGRLELRGPIVSRDQFVGYAKQYWRTDKSPLWRDPPRFETGMEAYRLFKHLDRDRDGYLTATEISPALRAEFKEWDRDQDGWISPIEYQAYFARRLDRVYREVQQRSDRPLPSLTIVAPADERPQVMRAGKLPPGLPAWFEQLDADGDGQIALFEWRRAAWPLAEFAKLDLNDDGLLTPGEVLKLLAVTERDGSRPFAYLMQKRVDMAGRPSGK